MKFIKKTIAGISSLLIATTCFASCGHDPEDNKESGAEKLAMADMLKAGMQMNAGTGELVVKVSAKEDGQWPTTTDAEIKVNFSVDGDKFALNNLSVDVKEDERKTSFSLDGAIVSDKNNVYINSAPVMDAVKDVVKSMAYDDEEEEMLNSLDFSSIGWVSVPIADAPSYSPSVKFVSTATDMVKDAVKGSATISETDDGYAVEVDTPEALAMIMDKLAKGTEDNKDMFAEEAKGLINSLMSNSDTAVDTYTDLAKDTVKAVFDEVGISYTDDNIEQIFGSNGYISDVMEELDGEEIDYAAEEAVQDIGELFAEMRDTLQPDNELIDSASAKYEVSLIGKEGSREFAQSLQFSCKGHGHEEPYDLGRSWDDEVSPEVDAGEPTNYSADISIFYTFSEKAGAVSIPEGAKTVPEVAPIVIQLFRDAIPELSDAFDELKGQSFDDLYGPYGDDAIFFGDDDDYTPWDDDPLFYNDPENPWNDDLDDEFAEENGNEFDEILKNDIDGENKGAATEQKESSDADGLSA